MKLHVLIFTFFGGRGHRTDFLLIFLNFDSVLLNSIPETFANICRTERDGISAINFEAARIHFPSDVFVAVAFVVA